jgi:tetratricopeptide (TPR) repeat protein
MRFLQPTAIVLAIVCLVAAASHSAQREKQPSYLEMDEARKSGWEMVRVVMDRLEVDDQNAFPGIQAWLKEFQQTTRGIDLKTPPSQWPVLDVDALATRNANFWRAFYEVAPGDPGLILLHAGMLLTSGEALRASNVVNIGNQTPGVPKELRDGFELIAAHVRNLSRKPRVLVREGVKLNNSGDYPGTIKKYREALALWPQDGLAHYELGQTLMFQELKAAGKEVPSGKSVTINTGWKFSKDVDAEYARARQHDPFQYMAYQGSDKEVIAGLTALVKRGMPVWSKLEKDPKARIDDTEVEQLAAACQEAGIHDLALAARGVMVIRRGRYLPADHPFITTSLRKLASGTAVDETLKRLNSPKPLAFRQLVELEK